jgi:auxin responsive GH3 family protein
MSKYTPHLRELLPTVPFLSSAYGATEGFFAIQADLLHYWEAAQAAKAVGEELSSYADFPRDPDGQSSYVLMPTTGAAACVMCGGGVGWG